MLDFNFQQAQSELAELREEWDRYYFAGQYQALDAFEQKISALESKVAQYLAESEWLNSLEHYYM